MNAPVLAVLGGGTLGQAVAKVAQAGGAKVRVWTRTPEARASLAETLSDVELAESVETAAREAQVVAFCVPASALRHVARQYGEVATGDQFVLHAVRGACPGADFILPHRVLREETCVRKIGVLGGPLYAPELQSNRPVAAVLASRFDETYEVVQRITANTPVRVHRSRDVVGVEVAGALSNVSALAVGMVEALELGDMARGVVLTQGLIEAARVGVALGAQPETFSGLAGVGDLIPRHVTSTERHYELGRALAEGTTLAHALRDMGKEVEGVLTAERVVAFAAHSHFEPVLCQAVHGVCAGTREAGEALEAVLTADLELGRGVMWS